MLTHLSPPQITGFSFSSSGELLRCLLIDKQIPFTQINCTIGQSTNASIFSQGATELSSGDVLWNTNEDLIELIDILTPELRSVLEQYQPLLIDLMSLVNQLQITLIRCSTPAFLECISQDCDAPKLILNKIDSKLWQWRFSQTESTLNAISTAIDVRLKELELLFENNYEHKLPTQKNIEKIFIPIIAPLVFPKTFQGRLPKLTTCPQSFQDWVALLRSQPLGQRTLRFYENNFSTKNLSLRIPKRVRLARIREVQQRIARKIISPTILRPIFSVMRNHLPMLRIANKVVVTRHETLVEVLESAMKASSRPLYKSNFERFSGDFVLAMNPCPAHTQEKELLQQTVQAEDLARIQENSRAYIQELLHARKSIDLVHDYVRVTAIKILIEDYFGVRANNSIIVAHCLRTVFNAIFLNFDKNAEVITQGDHAAALLKSVVLNCMKDNRQRIAAGQLVMDSVLLRMQLQQSSLDWLDEDAVCRNITGLIVGTVETLNLAFTCIVQELQNHPKQWRDAQLLAARSDDEGLLEYCREALRLNPPVGFLIRNAVKDFTLAESITKTKKQANADLPVDKNIRVNKGDDLILCLFSATDDPQAFANPKAFDHRRREEIFQFGFGLHVCQGKGLSEVLLSELLRGALLAPTFRACEPIKYEGILPRRWTFAID